VHLRNTALMKILLAGGADPDRADNSGRSARDYAMLDSKKDLLLETITANARKKDAQAARPVYGPTF
jgi:ankyrin repeat protein